MISKDFDILKMKKKKRNLDKGNESKIFGTLEHKKAKAREKDKISFIRIISGDLQGIRSKLKK